MFSRLARPVFGGCPAGVRRVFGGCSAGVRRVFGRCRWFMSVGGVPAGPAGDGPRSADWAAAVSKASHRCAGCHALTDGRRRRTQPSPPPRDARPQRATCGDGTHPAAQTHLSLLSSLRVLISNERLFAMVMNGVELTFLTSENPPVSVLYRQVIGLSH